MTAEKRECVSILVDAGLSIVKVCLFVVLAVRPSTAPNETGAKQMLLSLMLSMLCLISRHEQASGSALAEYVSKAFLSTISAFIACIVKWD